MRTEIIGNHYIIAGTERRVFEKSPFNKDGYSIFDGSIPNFPASDECSARWAIPPGVSSRVMMMVGNYEAIRSVSDGNGYVLMMLSDKQIVCSPVKRGENISFGIGNKSVDCMIADPYGRGLEMIEFGSPVFDPSMERQVFEGNEKVPKEFFEIKSLLETGNEKKAFTILKQYQKRNKHGH